MADETLGDKTEEPTPRRLQEARERGQVPRSSDLTAALILLVGVGALWVLGGKLSGTLMTSLGERLSFAEASQMTRDEVLADFAGSVKSLGLAVAPILAAVCAAAVMANLLQSGPVLSGHPLVPSLEKLSPVRGFGRIFSRRSLMRFAANMGKLVAIAWVSYVAIAGDARRILALGEMSPGEMAAQSGYLILALGLKLAVIFIVLAVLDYMYQRWQYRHDLRMTKQEVREEMKRMEGDPLIREQRRHIQRQMAMRRMSAEVPKADAVITNPTHVAVAVRYDAETMAAPRVVAKGADLLAQRIREIAMEHGVPIVEKPALARALYRAVEVGQEIPLKFYRAVAEVLAFVYRIANRQFRPTAV